MVGGEGAVVEVGLVVTEVLGGSGFFDGGFGSRVFFGGGRESAKEFGVFDFFDVDVHIDAV